MANKISRRTFVKGLAAGAASVAALGVLGSVEMKYPADGAGSDAGAGAGTIPVPAGNMSYTPGTYSASAKGIASDVTVTMTFDETSITDIQLDLSQETPDIGQVAGDELIKQCLTAQSSQIDGVSGATLTSNAVKKCLDDCIAQASGLAGASAEGTESASSDEDWLGTEPEITDDMVEEELSADVLIIGAGIAGVAAARSAAEEGASVIVVEKADMAAFRTFLAKCRPNLGVA